ncbi:MAG: hypothetical protein ACREPU_08065 [Rhodanobacteraceae bacterium]
MSACLVLIVGVAQCVFGVGQALWSQRSAARPSVWAEWIVFNLGKFDVVLAGTLLFATGIALFQGGARGSWLGAIARYWC